jgi:hypothetical protein
VIKPREPITNLLEWIRVAQLPPNADTDVDVLSFFYQTHAKKYDFSLSLSLSPTFELRDFKHRKQTRSQRHSTNKMRIAIRSLISYSNTQISLLVTLAPGMLNVVK